MSKKTVWLVHIVYTAVWIKEVECIAIAAVSGNRMTTNMINAVKEAEAYV